MAAFQHRGGRYWNRTSDLFRVKEARTCFLPPYLGDTQYIEFGALARRSLRSQLPISSPAQPKRSPRGCGATAPRLAPGTLPRGGPGRLAYFLAMNVYLPSSPDSLSIQITVHLPSPLNFAFTAPFLVSYTAHTSSDFSETDHS